MKKLIIITLVCITVSLNAIAQKSIKGKVTDADNQSLPGVSILVKNTNKGVISDFDGNYNINNIDENAVLVFTYLGFEAQEISINGKTVLNVVLKESAESLDEVVVVGYGSVNKRDLTTSIGSVDSEDIVKTATTNFDQALAGRISGVQVSSVDGTPGAALNIIIRGGNSITGDNSPLYVVDGIALEDFDPASISSNDIESYDVLKDASATAIYGSRGANGIIIITTKNGRKDGKTDVNFSIAHSLQWIPNRLEVLSPFQYVKYQEGIAFALDNYTPGSETSEFYNTWGNPELYRNIEGTSWQDEIFRLADTDQYNLSISGGNENTSLYFSSEYLNQEGTLINTGFKKIINNIRINHRINDKAKVSGQVQYAFSDRTGLNVSGDNTVSVIRDAVQFRPVEPINADGLLLGGVDPNDSNQRAFFNPVKNLENTDRSNRSDVVRGNLSLDYEFNDNLILKLSGNYQLNNTKQTLFFGKETQQGTNGINGINGTVTNRRIQTISTSNTLTYKKKFGKHNTNFLAGMEVQDRSTDFSSARNSQIPTDIFGIDKIGIGISPSIPVTAVSQNRLFSFFGRANYSYKYKYYLTATYRADASSKFKPENRWGYFPSFSAAWRINNEDFVKDIKFISDAKLRAGWGRTGNNRVGDFDAISQLDINANSGYVWGQGQTFVPGAFQSNLGVPDLRWETTDQLDIGLDLGFLDNKIEATIDYYKKETSDLLLNAETALHTGFERVQQNVGKTQNEGLEISINTRNIDNKNFKWSTSFNITFNKNKVVALNSGQDAIFTDPQWSGDAENQYITRIGQPVGQIYGLQFDRIYQVDDFVFDNALQSFTLKDGIPDNGALPIAPGSVKFIDQNGDGTINEADRVVIGNTQPKHFGGLNNSFEIGGFDVQVLLQWSYDFDILNANKSIFTVPRTRNSSGFTELADAWTPTNTDTNIGTTRYFSVFGRPPTGNLLDDRYVDDGSYLRLKTVSIGYSLPKDVLEKLKIKKLRLFITGQNLYTWTDYKGYDPDVSVGRFGALTPNLDWSAYPLSATIMTGINVTF
ncbi:SusC/RagA family TonB-linked outer membrane protein [Flavivirga rizhaonensis]|uniref:TonB-dependent receptor n=1 Tax=Flavivirga rizhaonensis TaxID=2559571 RepID=A0A4S1E434_9FLAO|nr:TonB-dependent receptor [Flavivirga rizhaonensis]TGV04762.1 TonB-dependent receptor [Flavivirga rizhaonensis]